MTQNSNKNTEIWTQKHVEYSIKYDLGDVCKELWQWLLTLGKEGKKLEFTLKEFTEYTKKLRGKARTFHWAVKQFEKLIFLRIIRIHKNFGHHSYTAELRHPDDTKPKIRKERNLNYHQVTLEKETSNDCNSVSCSNSSSSTLNNGESAPHTDNLPGNESNQTDEKPKLIDEKEKKRRLRIIQACAKHGILFNPKKATTEQLYKYQYDEVLNALEMYSIRNESTIITNPPGWLIECLRWKFHEDLFYTKENFIADITEVFFQTCESNINCDLNNKNAFT